MRKANHKKFNLPAVVFFFLVLFNLYATAFFVLHGELDFHSDIARDFLLLHEIEVKKIVLIGGNTSIAGVFHGPLWLYFNFPAYYLSMGDPIAVGAFRILAVVVFTTINFFIVKKLFGQKTAYLFTICVSSFVIPWGKAFNHPEFALLLMPTFFYTFWEYINTNKLKFLCFHILIAGVMIHLEIASGAPFFLLSSIFISYQIITKRKFTHFLAFFLILIPLSSYIIFELRHNFLQIKSFLKYVKETSSQTPYINILKDRARSMYTIGHLVASQEILNIITTLLSLFFVLKIVWGNGKNKPIYSVFLYFFCGYFLLTLFSKHFLLVHQYIAFVPIAMMTFLSLVETKYAKFVLPLILVGIIFNEIWAVQSINEARVVISSHASESSWKIMSQLSEDIFKNNPENEFGYFIYSPDKLSYVPKYGMVYATKRHTQKSAAYFGKKPITYVISAPAVLKDPWAKNFTDEWWIVSSIKITEKPISETRYSNGYTVKRYELNQDEINIPFDKFEDNGIHFR